jgi:hypothetical protein
VQSKAVLIHCFLALALPDQAPWLDAAARTVPQVIGFIYTAIVIVIRGTEIVVERGDFSDVQLFVWRFDALFAIPIVVFGFNCHANVVTIFTCAGYQAPH